MYKDLNGKDVFENKIEAIKALRLLIGKIQITMNPNPVQDAPHKREIEVYIPLRDAKDMVEACMALGVFDYKKDYTRHASSNPSAFPHFITEGQNTGYVTNYTLAGALVTARNDKSIEKITIKESDGACHYLFRNSKSQTFELDII